MPRNKLFWGLLVGLLFVTVVTGWAAAENGPAYIITADVVRGAQNATGPSCVLNNVFKLGEQVVFRADVYDATTGQLLDQQDIERLGLKVEAQVAGVGTFPMRYGPHPKEQPQVNFWAGAWQIPGVFKTGYFAWSIVVTDKQGRKAVYQPVGSRRPQMSGSWLVIEKR